MEKIYFDINPYTFTGSAYVIGLILANELSSLEQASIGNWLQLVGLTIQTYASQKEVVSSKEKDTKEVDLESLKEKISRIEQELDKISKSKDN